MLSNQHSSACLKAKYTFFTFCDHNVEKYHGNKYTVHVGLHCIFKNSSSNTAKKVQNCGCLTAILFKTKKY